MTLPYVRDTDPLNAGNRPGDGPLRPGGQSVESIPLTDANLPSTLSQAAKRQMPALAMMRTLWGGTQAVRAKSTDYLPMAPAESSTNYHIRLARSVFFNAVKHTVKGLVGMVMRRDPVFSDDVPEQIKAHLENIDNAGTHVDVFIAEILQDDLLAGHAAIFVEFPNTGGVQRHDEETIAAAPIRPYWIPIKKDNICSWRTTVENGITLLTQIVLKECTMVPDGDFGETEQTRYRVLYRQNGVVGFYLLQVTDRRSVIIVDDGIYTTQTEIPIAEIPSSDRKSLFESDPPLLDLGYLNVAHYQKWSDLATSEHKTCVPIFVRKGFVAPVDASGNQVVVGPDDGLDLPTEGDAMYVSHDGQSLDACRTSIRDLESNMATIGLSMLSSEKRVAETAEAKRIDKSASDSALARTARGVQDGIEKALYFHARYLNMPTGGSVTINRDFESLMMDPAMITALSGMVRDGQLTTETMWKQLQAGNVLPDDFDADEESAALEVEAELRSQKAVDIAGAQPGLQQKPATPVVMEDAA